MKLNLGCGSRKCYGWVNVDKVAACKPDQVVDLEKFPWPWPDNSVDEIILRHVLEHLGAETATYLKIIQELYRVCRDRATINIYVPHPRHDNYLSDPTHVRPITPDGLSLFSKENCLRWQKEGASNTPLAVYLGVDFETEVVGVALDEPWAGKFARKELSLDEINQAAASYNNVVSEVKIKMTALKG
jgi:hypothetical protein